MSSDLPPATNVRTWLESLVGCDCDHGYRFEARGDGTSLDTMTIGPVPCPRCVLVEVGGIRVRKRKDGLNDIVLPGVEVGDE